MVRWTYQARCNISTKADDRTSRSLRFVRAASGIAIQSDREAAPHVIKERSVTRPGNMFSRLPLHESSMSQNKSAQGHELAIMELKTSTRGQEVP